MADTKTGITVDEVRRILTRIGRRKTELTPIVFELCAEIVRLEREKESNPLNLKTSEDAKP